MSLPLKSLGLLTALTLGALAASCSSGGGSTSGASGGSLGFQLTRISLNNGAIWEVNREIEFEFSDPVDFSSVSLNTINLKTLSGAPATGTFFLRNDRTVVFQPNCPTETDLSDAGLQTQGAEYTITVSGRTSGATNTVRSTAGTPLDVTQVRQFETPLSADPAQAFLDTTLGPPVPVVRPLGSTLREGVSYIEIGRDPDPLNRIFFEVDALGNLSLFPSASELPLNLYSRADTEIAVVLEFNQPVAPTDVNVSSDRLRLEFQDNMGGWNALETDVRLIANCTSTGATVRLEPVGVLPAGTMIRPVVLAGFQDLVGDAQLLDVDDFAMAPTTSVSFPSLDPLRLDDLADEVFEDFLFGGDDLDSMQDVGAVFDTPAANWGDNGRLTASFDFAGSGGPGGDFDWIVRTGELVFFDTSSTPIIGGPGGIPTVIQTAVGGVVDVRDLIVEAGGEIRVQGVNPMQINASRNVIIRGRIDLSGFEAKDVATLNTGNQVEVGGAGAAGGGRGGSASEVITNSTPRGSPGGGPGGAVGIGGGGGESGYSPANNGKDARRPGGGGGGRFALDANVAVDPARGAGEEAEAGFDGSPMSRGAVTSLVPALGGVPGEGGFFDGDTSNDFFGVRPVVNGMGQLVDLIQGELRGVSGGYGGGGGGDALPAAVFPSPNWNISSDEKGGGGGGAGGGLVVKALGEIVFGSGGVILANGGRGATGENTNFLDHIGGTGGSGSGGHVILESAQRIDFTDGGLNNALPANDHLRALGGAQKEGPSTTGGPVSFGGKGGAGVLQLHVPNSIDPVGTSLVDPDVDIVVPLAAAGNIDALMSPAPFIMVPTFGARSKVRSEWISLGGADNDASGMPDLVQFLFGGVDVSADPTQNGRILTTTGTVDELSALVNEALEGSATLSIEPDAVTLAVRGATLTTQFVNATSGGLSNDLYLRTPALLRNFVLRLSAGGLNEEYVVADASYDEGAAGLGDEVLRIRVTDNATGSLQAGFNLLNPSGTVNVELIPRFFRVLRNGVEDALPDSAFIRIQFQATGSDANGNPDEAGILVDFTGDISTFNQAPVTPGDIRFFRFEVEFDLDAMGSGLTPDTVPVALDFLRVPFLF